MVGSGPNQVESMGFQHQDHFLNLERRRDREGSVHTTHTSRSQSQSGSHVSYEKNATAMQLEIDCLRRRLCCEWQKRTPSSSISSFDGDGDGSYKPGLRTLPSESFSCNEDHHYNCKGKSLSYKGLGNDAMSIALNQIFRSPFTRRIEGGRLPRQFT